MDTVETGRLVQPGDPAPDFTLPLVQQEGRASLSDYRGKSGLLLVLLRGVYCSFCRRHIGQLGVTRGKLQAVGVETLAVVASNLERARLYFRYRPAQVALAGDAELTTYRAYGVPRLAETPEFRQALHTVPVSLPELPKPLPVEQAGDVLHRLNPYEWTEIDRADNERQFGQPNAQFLVDRDGIVRWVSLEATQDNLARLGSFPTDDELLALARGL